MPDELHNVPADEVGARVQDYVDDGATTIRCTKQPDGRFTIIAD